MISFVSFFLTHVRSPLPHLKFNGFVTVFAPNFPGSLTTLMALLMLRLWIAKIVVASLFEPSKICSSPSWQG